MKPATLRLSYVSVISKYFVNRRLRSEGRKKSQDPAGIWTQDLLNISKRLNHYQQIFYLQLPQVLVRGRDKVLIRYSYKTLIGVHETHGRMHPN